MLDNSESEVLFNSKNILEYSMILNKGHAVNIENKLTNDLSLSLKAYQKLLNMTKSFAFTVTPKGIFKTRIKNYEVKTFQEGVRNVILIKNTDNHSHIMISGPYKEALFWCIDDINAKFKDIVLMYETVQQHWCSGSFKK